MRHLVTIQRGINHTSRSSKRLNIPSLLTCEKPTITYHHSRHTENIYKGQYLGSDRPVGCNLLLFIYYYYYYYYV